MSLLSDEVIQLTLDATLGRSPSIPGDEAKEFYEEVKQEVEEIGKRGHIVMIPHETPGLDDE